MRRIERGDPAYEAQRRAAVWNGLVPDRLPQAIVVPDRREQVAYAVRDATAQGLQVAVKSGGHNWTGACLRDDGVLIDLGAIDDVEVDPTARRALVGPAATHRALAEALVPHGLGFPIGHCPSVGLGGYLLAGGTGWNMREWGPGCWNVTGADVVTADGRERYIDQDHEPDLFWALRGGGPGFPAIVTRFHLALRELPQICTRHMAFETPAAAEMLPWVAQRLTALGPGYEMALIARRALDGDREPRVTLAVTTFGATDGEAEDRSTRALDGAASVATPIEDSGPSQASLDALEGEGGWVEGLRYAADSCWVSGGYREVGEIVAEAIERAPGTLSRAVLAFGFMPEPEPDTAFTRLGNLIVNLYATWTRGEDDNDNAAWVQRHMRQLGPYLRGRYIGEADLTVNPERVAQAYAPEKLRRLRAIAERYDSAGRLHGFLRLSS